MHVAHTQRHQERIPDCAKESLMVNGPGFSWYRRKVLEIYKESRYEDALEVSLEAQSRFKERESETLFWIACLKSLLNRRQEALDALRKSLDRGFWWSPQMLERERDFHNIRHEAEFGEILAICEQRYQEAKTKSRSECLWYYPSGIISGEAQNLFIALHPHAGNAADFSIYFKERVLERGFILALPQSSRLWYSGSYCWDDFELAKREVIGHYKEISGRYPISKERTIVSGASRGATLAMQLVLEENELGASKMLLFMPAICDPKIYFPLFERPKAQSTCGYIIAGSMDQFLSNTRALVEKTEQSSLPYRIEVVEGLGHYLPDDFDAYLDRAIEFLNAH